MRLTLAATLTASLVLAGCSGGDDEKDKGDGKVGGDEQAVATWPLTGLPVAEGESSATDYPVYAVKIDNSNASDPQYGLSQADLVVEELVEGSETRLAVLFHSQLAEKAGPVRSMRLTDIGIVKPVDGELVTSGAAPITIRGLKKAGVEFNGMDNSAVVRLNDGTHDSLHSVVADLTRLAEKAKGEAARPDDYLPWGSEDDFIGGQKATDVDVEMSGRRTAQWSFADGGYHLDNGYMAKGDEFVADTVIVASVDVSYASYEDGAGNPVPHSHFEGKGKVVIFHDGEAMRGTWEKDGEGGELTFRTQAGEIKVPAGNVWLHLVPAEGSVVPAGGVTFQ